MHRSTSLNKYRLIIPKDMITPPNDFEKAIARILAKFFRSNIIFIDTTSTHTPDLLVERLSQTWELKTINGSKKNTIHHILNKAKNQSLNIVIAVGKTKYHTQQILGRIRKELVVHPNIKRVLLITKTKTILVVKGKI